jgi:biopolymer transport protein ExbD/biopolymer transport protein TolR
MLRRRREGLPLNAEINVVSLIDVMLLLLVIFMITAPMMQGGVDVALPKADAKPLNQPKSGLVVTVDRHGAVYVDQTKMNVAEFRASFRALAANRTRDGVYLRGDAGVPYGVVTQVLAIMRAAGVGDVGLVTDAESQP